MSTGRPCTVCRHGQRAAFDAAIVAGESAASISSRFGHSARSINRHRAHVSTVMQAAAAAQAVDFGGSLLERARAANAEAWEVLTMAKQAENPGAVLAALDRVGRLLVIEGAFLAQEGPTDRALTIQWEEPEVAPCARCGHAGE